MNQVLGQDGMEVIAMETEDHLSSSVLFDSISSDLGMGFGRSLPRA